MSNKKDFLPIFLLLNGLFLFIGAIIACYLDRNTLQLLWSGLPYLLAGTIMITQDYIKEKRIKDE